MNETKATRFHRHRRWAEGGAVAARGAVLAAAAAIGPAVPLSLVPLYGMALSVACDAAAAPLSAYSRLVLERRYRSRRLGAWTWVAGYLRAAGARAVWWAAVASAVQAVARTWPGYWWAIVGVAGTLGMLTLAVLWPVVCLRPGRHLRTIRRPALRARVEALAERCGVPVVGVYESRDANLSGHAAALIGLGAARRVVLSPTLVADYSDDEIEVILAHELAHCVHHDLGKMIGFESAAWLAAGLVADVAARALLPHIGIGGPADPASLPLLALAAGATVIAAAPLRHLLSRRCERLADRRAIETTGKADALASGLRRLADDTLAEDRPSRVVQWLFHSHPPVSERVLDARRTFEDAPRHGPLPSRS